MKQAILLLPILASYVGVARGAPVIRSETRRTVVSGSTGYDTDTEAFYYSSKEGTVAACSAACQRQKKCESFAVGNGECNLYNVPVTANFARDYDSIYAFYDAIYDAASSTSSSLPSIPDPTTDEPQSDSGPLPPL